MVNVGLPGSLILYLTEPLCRSESMIPAVLQFWNISNRTVLFIRGSVALSAGLKQQLFRQLHLRSITFSKKYSVRYHVGGSDTQLTAPQAHRPVFQFAMKLNVITLGIVVLFISISKCWIMRSVGDKTGRKSLRGGWSLHDGCAKCSGIRRRVSQKWR